MGRVEERNSTNHKVKQMLTDTRIKKFLTFPVFLISSGSFVGLIGWWGLAQTASGIIFFIGSMLLSLSGSITTLWGLLSLERTEPSPFKIRKLKEKILKDLKIAYPSYILRVENLTQKQTELSNKFPFYRSCFENFRDDTRLIRTELNNLEKQLENKLRQNAAKIDHDSAEGIAQKILWSEKQIYLTQLNESLEKLTDLFTSSDVEQYRLELTNLRGRISHLEHGTDTYRELMILCNKEDAQYDDIQQLKQKIDDLGELMSHQERKILELGTWIKTKYEKSKKALLQFHKRITEFEQRGPV